MNYQPGVGYYWSGPGRPARTDAFSARLVEGFLLSQYANHTSLATFIREHRFALEQGTLNQLHRRHIISWETIKSFALACARLNPDPSSREVYGLISQVFSHFGVEPLARNAQTKAHGAERASAWTAVANEMCWTDSNVFIGPSANNHGTEIDLAIGARTEEIAFFLAGTAWRSAIPIEYQMRTFASAV
ncbi:hypothetical protein [Paracoccus aminophilus]|nr:hypothetical protein [Paracoccus aminophilus]